MPTAIPTDTLLVWRDLALSACQHLATVVASMTARRPGSVWEFDEATWRAAPTATRAQDWGRELRSLSGEVLQAMGGTFPYPRGPADAYFLAILEAWEDLDAYGATSCPDFDYIVPFFRALVEAHRTIARAHRHLAQISTCSYSLQEVSSSFVLPTVTTMVQHLAIAAGHLASPHHFGGEDSDDDSPPSTPRLPDWMYESGRSTPISLRSYSPPGSPATGGYCGAMFSPPGELDDALRDEDGHPVRQPTPRPTPLSRGRGLGATGRSATRATTARARQEEAAMASADLFGVRDSMVESRVAQLEGQVGVISQQLAYLIRLAEGATGTPIPPYAEGQPSQAQARGEEATHSGRGHPAATTPPAAARRVEARRGEVSEAQASEESAAVRLRVDKRKERQQVLKVLLPWAKPLAVLPDRTALLRPLLHQRYGPPLYHNIGDVAALEDGVRMYRSFAYGQPAAPDDTAPVYPFRFTSALALGLVYFRTGGPLREDAPLYLRTQDFLPLVDGEDRQLIHVNEAMFSDEPSWSSRRPPTTMAAFRDRGLRFAGWLGMFWGRRARYEVSLTVEILHDRGARSPTLMTPAMACHLLDQLVMLVLESVCAMARGEAPLPVGTDPLTPAQRRHYELWGFSTDGETLIASMTSSYMQTWYHEPLQAAALSDVGRRSVAMRLMGMDVPSNPPPKGGPTGGDDQVPPSPPPPATPPVRAAFTVEEAEAATSGMAPAGTTGSVCLRSLSVKGCQRGAKCRFLHVDITARQLRQKYSSNSHLKKIMDFFGGPSPVDIKATPTRASPSVPPAASGRSGRQPTVGGGDSSDSDDSEEDVPGPLASGGMASGGIDVQVPYLRDLPGCYPRASTTDSRSAPPCVGVLRPATTHADSTPQPFHPPSIHPRSRLAPPSTSPPVLGLPTSRAGIQAFSVTPDQPDGTFTVSLGTITLQGRDAGQELRLPSTTVTNACVTLSFARVLGLLPDTLFEELVAQARVVSRAMGPPALLETHTSILLRSVCHDVVASEQHGHPLDALTPLYLPPRKLLSSVVAVLHTLEGRVAVDVLVGPQHDERAPVGVCLQRRGSPGHMQPLDPSPLTLPQLQQWAHQFQIPLRLLPVASWRDWLAADADGPSQPWADHDTCDYCRAPRFPLPSPL